MRDDHDGPSKLMGCSQAVEGPIAWEGGGLVKIATDIREKIGGHSGH